MFRLDSSLGDTFIAINFGHLLFLQLATPPPPFVSSSNEIAPTSNSNGNSCKTNSESLQSQEEVALQNGEKERRRMTSRENEGGSMILEPKSICDGTRLY